MSHVQKRMQQRAIPPEALALLQLYGRQEFQKGGCEVLSISRKERQRLIKTMKRLQRLLEGNNGIYQVCSSEGEMITVGHQYKKVRTEYQ